MRPRTVAEQARSGHDLEEAGERDVWVLFVDIRGYTAHSESRGAPEIFPTVNQYRETVLEIVREYGGSAAGGSDAGRKPPSEKGTIPFGDDARR